MIAMLIVLFRDCSMSNFVMDPGKMYPRGFHPDHVMRDARGRSLANVRTRTQAGGVKYFFIDFGESMRFGENEEPLVSVIRKASIFAPEMEDESVLLYDAYKADIYALGMTFELQFLKVRFIASSSSHLYTDQSFSASLRNMSTISMLSSLCSTP